MSCLIVICRMFFKLKLYLSFDKKRHCYFRCAFMKQIVYTANPESEQIHVWSLNHDGALTLVQFVDVSGQVQPMMVSPD